ncbi:phage tail length tape measure protein [Enterobacter sp. Bisph1]|uniref:phage tail length tape measure protein n=1 Tax=Enterobacter sp. Bisph1 TaxID=1274399 RepID=UPI00057C02D5|nr:phage tail length tape measure protein [Enterobacter sp. Bisph1]
MSNSTNIEELLTAVDQATRPFKNQQTTSVSLSASINATETSLRNLNDQLAQVGKLKQTEKELASVSVKLRVEQERALELAGQTQTPENANVLALSQLRVSRLQQQQSRLSDTVAGQRSELTQSGLNADAPSEELARLQNSISESTALLDTQQKSLKKVKRREKIEGFQAALQDTAEKFSAVGERGKSIAATGFNLGKMIMQPGYEASLNADPQQSEGGPASGKQGGNLGTDLQALQDAYQSLSVDFFATQESSLRMLVQTATEFVGKLQQWVQNNQGIVQSFGMVATTVVGVAGAVGYVASAIGPVFSGISGLITIATSLGSVFTTVFGGIVTILGSLTLPIIGAIAVFAAAALAIYTFWEPVSAFFGGVVEGIKAGFAPLADLFTPFKPVFDAIGSALSAVKNLFSDLIAPITFSQNALESCGNAGEIVGRILFEMFSLPFAPLKALINGVSWLLEKMGVVNKQASIELPAPQAATTGATFDYVQPTSTMSGFNNYQAAKPTGGNSYVDQSKREYNVTLQGDIRPGSDSERYLLDLFRQDADNKRNATFSQFNPSGGF